jgi:hypothetical protein
MPGYSNWYNVSLTNQQSHNKFELKFNLLSPVLSLEFDQAADYTAQCIAKNYSNLHLALSGGLDSEFVANVLTRNHIPFTPVVVAFKKTQEHYYALEWCRTHGVVPLVLEFDEDDINYVKYCHSITKQYRIHSVSNLMSCYIANLIKDRGGHLLTGDPTITRLTQYYNEPAGDLYRVYWFEFLVELIYPGQHPCGFFFYTPELALSYAQHVDTGLNDASARAKLYQTVPYRPKHYPPPVPLSPEIRNKMKVACRELAIRETGCEWTKENFIGLLTNLNNSI